MVNKRRFGMALGTALWIDKDFDPADNMKV